MPKLICAEVNEIFRNLCRSSPVPKFGYPLGNIMGPSDDFKLLIIRANQSNWFKQSLLKIPFGSEFQQN